MVHGRGLVLQSMFRVQCVWAQDARLLAAVDTGSELKPLHAGKTGQFKWGSNGAIERNAKSDGAKSGAAAKKKPAPASGAAKDDDEVSASSDSAPEDDAPSG